MSKIKLSITPLQDAIWYTHATGARYLIAPLIGEDDAQITRDCSDLAGNVDIVRFGVEVAKRCCRGWEGVGDKTGELPCNEKNIELHAKSHAFTIMPWFIRSARSLDHYRVQEIGDAKKG